MIVMRVLRGEPRTTISWKGLYQRPRIWTVVSIFVRGVAGPRKVLTDVLSLGLPRRHRMA